MVIEMETDLAREPSLLTTSKDRTFTIVQVINMLDLTTKIVDKLFMLIKEVLEII